MDTNHYFQQLEKEFETYQPMLSKAIDAILDQEVSEYPIFVAHQQPAIDFGLPLVDRAEVQGNWSIHASTLEEFATKQLIQADKVDDFKEVYKDPKEHICVFAIQEIGATFVFIPRK